MGKKSKKTANASASPVIEQAITDQGNKKKGLISDTTCSGLGKTSWQSTYNLIEAEEPEVTTVEATVDTTQKTEGTLKDLADSFLHRIAAREQILPYTDVVRWAIEELPITDRTFCTRDGRVFGSFQANDLRQMYHLPEPEKKYNKAFLEKFRNENETESEPIRNWRQNPAKHKHKSSGKLTSAKTLEQSCYSELEKTGRLIAGINSLTWDTYWMFLVKPYSQRAALKCLSDAIGCIIPEIQDATYDAQLNSRLNRPPEVEPMLEICQLRTRDEQPK